jgi:hypothetical protein
VLVHLRGDDSKNTTGKLLLHVQSKYKSQTQAPPTTPGPNPGPNPAVPTPAK